MWIRHLALLFTSAVIMTITANAAEADPAAAQGDRPFVNPTGELTLADALALALEQNPTIEAFSWDVRAAEAKQLQAGLRPNPELSLEVENLRYQQGPRSTGTRLGATGTLGGFSPEFERTRESGAESGLAESEVTLGISQLVELGGKRAKRIQAASREREVAAWDYEITRANVLTDTAKAFYAVVSAQARVTLGEELEALAKQVLDTVIARVEAGKVSPIERTRGEVEYAATTIELERTRREMKAARIQLATHWGATTAAFSTALGGLAESSSLPPLSDLQKRAEGIPDVSRWMAELEQRDAAIDLERANAKPDLTVSLGLRSTGVGSRQEMASGFSLAGDWSRSRTEISPDDSREEMLALGFSLPLPLANRNQGRIREAQHLAAKAAAQKRSEDVGIQAKLATTYFAVDAVVVELQTLREEILPKAQEAFDATNEGYRNGKFGLLDVLQAQHTLFENRARLLEAQAAYSQGVVDVERLTGLSLFPELKPITSQEEKQ